ncbi:hypothetical protein F4782DRAFT_381197 [Xylaria castorea]|nr:hypothetical protein F4782DRAFT_381197 [Xylaria castorea]
MARRRHNPKRAPPPHGADVATVTPDPVEEASQELLGLEISNAEAGSSHQPPLDPLKVRASAMMVQKRDGYAFTRQDLDVSAEDGDSYAQFIINLTFELCLLRLRHGSEDIFAEFMYDQDVGDVKVWIWIHAGRDWQQTMEKVQQFESRFMELKDEANKLNPPLCWDQLRVVWRISYEGYTYSREDTAGWGNQHPQREPLMFCLIGYPSYGVSLGWFQDDMGMPIKSWVNEAMMASRQAEAEGTMIVTDTA